MAAYARENRRKKNLPAGAQGHGARPMMEDEIFKVYFGNPQLRTALRRGALAYGRRHQNDRTDLVQVAWMHIAQCRPYQTIEYYAMIGLRAMDRYRKRELDKQRYDLDDLECMSMAEYNMWKHGCY